MYQRNGKYSYCGYLDLSGTQITNPNNYKKLPINHVLSVII